MKAYPLEIQETDGYYSKGHHDREVFAGAIAEYCGKIIDPGKAEHRYWRFTPDSTGQEHGYYHCAMPGRGAFPVTVWEG